MRRSGFKQKLTTPMKRTPLKRVSDKKVKKRAKPVNPKSGLRTTKSASICLWELCKKIIRVKYPNTCYTCSKGSLEGSGWHTGHMWAKASLGNHLKYDLRILRPQCYHCNINLGGMGAVFYAKMLKEFGQEYMDSLDAEKQILLKADEIWYDEKIKEYERILSEM